MSARNLRNNISVTPQHFRPKTKMTSVSMKEVENIFAEDSFSFALETPTHCWYQRVNTVEILIQDMKAKIYIVFSVQ